MTFSPHSKRLRADLALVYQNGDGGGKRWCSMSPVQELPFLDPSYHLLEESRKLWEHAVSDAVVYSLDPVEVAGDSGAKITEYYINGRFWIECHVSLIRQANLEHLLILIDSYRETSRRGRPRPM